MAYKISYYIKPLFVKQDNATNTTRSQGNNNINKKQAVIFYISDFEIPLLESSESYQLS